jgi:endogenous inhibitor of DNA gyrase (YacG/DUF329 family)
MKSACPICHKGFESEAQRGPFPFCSWRCKKLDLHSWLNEEYRFSEPVTPSYPQGTEADDESNEREAPV